MKILIVVNIFYFSYQVFWGMLYFQTPIIRKLESQKKPEIARAKELALRYLENAKYPELPYVKIIMEFL